MIDDGYFFPGLFIPLPGVFYRIEVIIKLGVFFHGGGKYKH